MWYIHKNSDEDGNHGNPQGNYVEGVDMVALPEDLLEFYIATMGFAMLTVDDGVVTAVEINQAAYDTYQAEHPTSLDPEPEPTEIEVLRAQVNTLSVATSIAFVTLAEAGSIDDVTAGEHADMFAPWEPDVSYGVGNIRKYDGQLYRCVQAHTSQADWTPDAAVSLWAKIADPADEWPEWSQPVGAHDAYQTGDKVTHNGQHWISTVDNNVWTPGAYGWELAKEGGKS